MRIFGPMPSYRKPIGVFDSGIGGLTVLRRLRLLMPDMEYVYLGDTARVPYGNKSADTIRRYAMECAAFLLKHDVSMIVVACNTASALALDSLRAHIHVPVIGMIEPAAKAARLTTRNGKIGIIGTRATIASDAYAREIQDQEVIGTGAATQPLELFSRPCPLFVPLVEEGWLDKPATRMIADEYLRPLLAERIDTLVLGCTHYPMLAPLIQELAPDVTLIDCGEVAAEEASYVLKNTAHAVQDTVSSDYGKRLQVYLTDYTPNFQQLAREFLGVTVDEPVRTSLS